MGKQYFFPNKKVTRDNPINKFVSVGYLISRIKDKVYGQLIL